MSDHRIAILLAICGTFLISISCKQLGKRDPASTTQQSLSDESSLMPIKGRLVVSKIEGLAAKEIWSHWDKPLERHEKQILDPSELRTNKTHNTFLTCAKEATATLNHKDAQSTLELRGATGNERDSASPCNNCKNEAQNKFHCKLADRSVPENVFEDVLFLIPSEPTGKQTQAELVAAESLFNNMIDNSIEEKDGITIKDFFGNLDFSCTKSTFNNKEETSCIGFGSEVTN